MFAFIPRRGRTIIICIGVAANSAATLYLSNRSQAWNILLFVSLAGGFALAGTPKKNDDYSPLYGPPQLVLVGLTGVYLLMSVVAANPITSGTVYFWVSLAGYIVGAVVAVILNRLTQFVPNTLEVEAVSWLLESSSPWPQPEWFEKASRVAATPQRKVVLLKTLHLLLPSLIASHRQHRPAELEHNELRMFLACLAEVSNFKDSGRKDYLRNKAAIEHPKLPDSLREQLEELRECGDRSLKDAAESVLCHYPAIEDQRRATRFC